MKIYGSGTMKFPGSGKVLHDFADGPFETEDQGLIDAALKQGFSKDKSQVKVEVQDKVSSKKKE